MRKGKKPQITVLTAEQCGQIIDIICPQTKGKNRKTKTSKK